MGNGFKLSDPSPVRKERILLLSTQHLTDGTLDWLEDKVATDSLPLHRRSQHGYFLRVDSYLWNPPDLPGDLVAVLQFAKDRNVEWVLLDDDEQPIKGLPNYNED
jgi:hypothetical protein